MELRKNGKRESEEKRNRKRKKERKKYQNWKER